MFSSRLPSTASLRAFESAARHLSCTGAADELCLTQSAVSKQLRGLEQNLGVALFGRTTQGLALTQAGGQYLDTARQVLERLELATSALVKNSCSRSSIRLQVMQTLGEKWLMPRLATFLEHHPGIDIQFAETTLSGHRITLPDAAFRFGAGQWPDHDAQYLFGNDVVLVCAPNLLGALGDSLTERSFSALRWLVHSHVPEHLVQCLRQYGLPHPGMTPRVIQHGYYSLVIQSAVAGLGLALIPRTLVMSELQTGQLKNPFGIRFSSNLGYHLVQSKANAESAELDTFCRWVLLEARATSETQYQED